MQTSTTIVDSVAISVSITDTTPTSQVVNGIANGKPGPSFVDGQAHHISQAVICSPAGVGGVAEASDVNEHRHYRFSIDLRSLQNSTLEAGFKYYLRYGMWLALE